MKPAPWNLRCLPMRLPPMQDGRVAAGAASGRPAARPRATGPSVGATLMRPWVWLVLALGHGPTAGQDLYYVEPGVTSCPRVPEPQAERPRAVALGTPVRGRLHVGCGFADGSYTVTLGATDPGAVFAPRTFLVNFGQIVGSGAYDVTFATVGTHRVTASISSNMGSPAVRGQFVGPDAAFTVVAR